MYARIGVNKIIMAISMTIMNGIFRLSPNDILGSELIIEVYNRRQNIA
jgi:hypothetical protein